MFHTHAARIASFAQASPDNMFRVMEFVLTTIRMPLYRTPIDMAALRKQGENAICLWGFKREAWRYMKSHKDQIFADAMELHGNPDPIERERGLIAYFAGMPGFGLVKGGFVAQLAFDCGGCLDMHNIERFGLRQDDFKASRFKGAKTAKTRAKMLDVYQDLLRICGGTARLWDDWCAYVANEYPNTYDNAFHVSAIHCEALGLPSHA